jgi:hypothetical protein
MNERDYFLAQNQVDAGRGREGVGNGTVKHAGQRQTRCLKAAAFFEQCSIQEQGDSPYS